MKTNTRFLYSFILLACVGFYSCTKPDISFGENYLDNNYTNLVAVDTATPVISTVLIDSFATSGTGKAIIGKYTDPYFGQVTADAYFPLTLPTYLDVYSNTTYDRLELIVRPNKSFYGDTSQQIHIKVNQLKQLMEFPENRSELYNKSTFVYETQTLGSKVLNVRPSVTDSIFIPLSDEAGLEIFNKLKAQDEQVSTSDKFTNYFKGVRISSDGFMLGLYDSVIMRLHYKEAGFTTQNKYTDFTLSSRALQFNHIEVDRSGKPTAKLSTNKAEIPSDTTNNIGYLQAATGTIVKIRFPYLRNFLKVDDFLKIVKAELVVTPVQNSYSGIYPLPPQLRLSQTTQFNAIGSDITNNSTSTPQVLYGNLYIDDLYNRNTNYTYDITAYINAIINDASINGNGLLLSPPSPAFQVDFNRLLVGDKNNANGSIKLRIYYLTVNIK